MLDKKYWWYVKRIKEDPIRVSEAKGKQIEEAWLAGAEQIQIRPGLTIQGGKNITAVEASMEVQEDTKFRLGDGLDPFNPLVVMTPDGNVATNWYKKWVGGKKYDTHYAHIPSYKLLERNGDTCLIAMRLPEYAPMKIYTEAELCTPLEVRRLDALSDL